MLKIDEEKNSVEPVHIHVVQMVAA